MTMSDQPRDRPAPRERFAGPEHLFDLHEIASRLRTESGPVRDGHRQITIFRKGQLTLILFDFEAGGRLADHRAEAEVMIMAVTGRLEVSTADATHRLASGSVLVLDAGVRHDVRAPEPSQMLLAVTRANVAENAAETAVATTPDPAAPSGHAFDAEITAEQRGWNEIMELVRSLDPDAIARPGYFSDPDWSIADLVAHLGTWLAEAGIQIERIRAGTYEPREIDIDALNAQFHAAMSGQPWDVILTQAQASRYRMLKVWYRLPTRSDDAAWWVAKAGAEHYREHLDRLRAWVSTLRDE